LSSARPASVLKCSALMLVICVVSQEACNIDANDGVMKVDESVGQRDDERVRRAVVWTGDQCYLAKQKAAACSSSISVWRLSRYSLFSASLPRSASPQPLQATHHLLPDLCADLINACMPFYWFCSLPVAAGSAVAVIVHLPTHQHRALKPFLSLLNPMLLVSNQKFTLGC
jgi:hypothetical protein